jgi:translin
VSKQFAEDISKLAEESHQVFEARTRARDQALMHARQLTRHSAHAIRAIHRNEQDVALEQLEQGRGLLSALQQELEGYHDLYHAGYTQDAIKEFCEASITCALIQESQMPFPGDLGAEAATYLNGLAEVPGELRRRCLDLLRHGYSPDAERLLAIMDEIYAVLVTMDYPDAVTNGLRRQTDMVRGIVERTRADLTLSLREDRLLQALQSAETRLGSGGE